jgi:hypothetical protein
MIYSGEFSWCSLVENLNQMLLRSWRHIDRRSPVAKKRRFCERWLPEGHHASRIKISKLEYPHMFADFRDISKYVASDMKRDTLV